MEIIQYDSRETVATLKNTVAIGATDAEFSMFVNLCKSTGLNPFKKEIWFVKANGRAQIMTGINGFRAIANANDQYDGTELGLISAEGDYKTAAYPKDDYIGAWAKCYRKDRKIPSEGIAMLADYDKKFGNWKSMRRVMIMKCAESVALRSAFPQQLNGLYTTEEMPKEYIDAPEPTVVEVSADAARISVTPETFAIRTKCKFTGWELGKVDETDPDWIPSVVNDPAKFSRLQAIDQVALKAYVVKVAQAVTTSETGSENDKTLNEGV